jgi:hypothetical protein
MSPHQWRSSISVSVPLWACALFVDSLLVSLWQSGTALRIHKPVD